MLNPVRFISLLLVLCLLCQDILFAQGGVSQLSTPVVSPTVEVPQNLASSRISKSFYNQETIINIQDAHESIDAQKKIADILDTLSKKYDLSLVGLEGSSGAVDTSLLSAFPKKEIREKAADYLLRQTKISGAEFFKIVSGNEKVELYGVEDESLYRKNLRSFQRALENRDRIEEELKKVRLSFKKVEQLVFSDALYDLNEAYRQYEGSEISFKELWPLLQKIAEFSNLSIKKYGELRKLLHVQRLEHSIRFAEADVARQSLVGELQQRLPKNQTKLLIEKALQFKLAKLTAYEFHSYLLRVAEEAGVDTSNYSSLKGYVRYVKTFESINLLKLFEELEALKDVLKIRLYRNEDEKKLDETLHVLMVLSKLLDTTLSSKDYDFYRFHETQFEIDSLRNVLNSFIERHPGLQSRQIDWDFLGQAIPSARNFYEDVVSRNESLVNNLLSKMRSDKVHVAALITGGFHSDGLSDLMARDQVSHIVILPKFEEKEGKRPYLTVITKKGSFLDSELKKDAQRESITMVLSGSVKSGMPFAEARSLLAKSYREAKEKEGYLFSEETLKSVQGNLRSVSASATAVEEAGNKSFQNFGSGSVLASGGYAPNEILKLIEGASAQGSSVIVGGTRYFIFNYGKPEQEVRSQKVAGDILEDSRVGNTFRKSAARLTTASTNRRVLQVEGLESRALMAAGSAVIAGVPVDFSQIVGNAPFVGPLASGTQPDMLNPGAVDGVIGGEEANIEEIDKQIAELVESLAKFIKYEEVTSFFSIPSSISSSQLTATIDPAILGVMDKIGELQNRKSSLFRDPDQPKSYTLVFFVVNKAENSGPVELKPNEFNSVTGRFISPKDIGVPDPVSYKKLVDQAGQPLTVRFSNTAQPIGSNDLYVALTLPLVGPATRGVEIGRVQIGHHDKAVNKPELPTASFVQLPELRKPGFSNSSDSSPEPFVGPIASTNQPNTLPKEIFLSKEETIQDEDYKLGAARDVQAIVAKPANAANLPTTDNTVGSIIQTPSTNKAANAVDFIMGHDDQLAAILNPPSSVAGVNSVDSVLADPGKAAAKTTNLPPVAILNLPGANTGSNNPSVERLLVAPTIPSNSSSQQTAPTTPQKSVQPIDISGSHGRIKPSTVETPSPMEIPAENIEPAAENTVTDTEENSAVEVIDQGNSSEPAVDSENLISALPSLEELAAELVENTGAVSSTQIDIPALTDSHESVFQEAAVEKQPASYRWILTVIGIPVLVVGTAIFLIRVFWAVRSNEATKKLLDEYGIDLGNKNSSGARLAFKKITRQLILLAVFLFSPPFFVFLNHAYPSLTLNWVHSQNQSKPVMDNYLDPNLNLDLARHEIKHPTKLLDRFLDMDAETLKKSFHKITQERFIAFNEEQNNLQNEISNFNAEIAKIQQEIEANKSRQNNILEIDIPAERSLLAEYKTKMEAIRLKYKELLEQAKFLDKQIAADDDLIAKKVKARLDEAAAKRKADRNSIDTSLTQLRDTHNKWNREDIPNIDQKILALQQESDSLEIQRGELDKRADAVRQSIKAVEAKLAVHQTQMVKIYGEFILDPTADPVLQTAVIVYMTRTNHAADLMIYLGKALTSLDDRYPDWPTNREQLVSYNLLSSAIRYSITQHSESDKRLAIQILEAAKNEWGESPQPNYTAEALADHMLEELGQRVPLRFQQVDSEGNSLAVLIPHHLLESPSAARSIKDFETAMDSLLTPSKLIEDLLNQPNGQTALRNIQNLLAEGPGIDLNILFSNISKAHSARERAVAALLTVRNPELIRYAAIAAKDPEPLVSWAGLWALSQYTRAEDTPPDSDWRVEVFRSAINTHLNSFSSEAPLAQSVLTLDPAQAYPMVESVLSNPKTSANTRIVFSSAAYRLLPKSRDIRYAKLILNAWLSHQERTLGTQVIPARNLPLEDGVYENLLHSLGQISNEDPVLKDQLIALVHNTAQHAYETNGANFLYKLEPFERALTGKSQFTLLDRTGQLVTVTKDNFFYYYLVFTLFGVFVGLKYISADWGSKGKKEPNLFRPLDQISGAKPQFSSTTRPAIPYISQIPLVEPSRRTKKPDSTGARLARPYVRLSRKGEPTGSFENIAPLLQFRLNRWKELSKKGGTISTKFIDALILSLLYQQYAQVPPVFVEANGRGSIFNREMVLYDIDALLRTSNQFLEQLTYEYGRIRYLKEKGILTSRDEVRKFELEKIFRQALSIYIYARTYDAIQHRVVEAETASDYIMHTGLKRFFSFVKLDESSRSAFPVLLTNLYEAENVLQHHISTSNGDFDRAAALTLADKQVENAWKSFDIDEEAFQKLPQVKQRNLQRKRILRTATIAFFGIGIVTPLLIGSVSMVSLLFTCSSLFISYFFHRWVAEAPRKEAAEYDRDLAQKFDLLKEWTQLGDVPNLLSTAFKTYAFQKDVQLGLENARRGAQNGALDYVLVMGTSAQVKKIVLTNPLIQSSPHTRVIFIPDDKGYEGSFFTTLRAYSFFSPQDQSFGDFFERLRHDEDIVANNPHLDALSAVSAAHSIKELRGVIIYAGGTSTHNEQILQRVPYLIGQPHSYFRREPTRLDFSLVDAFQTAFIAQQARQGGIYNRYADADRIGPIYISGRSWLFQSTWKRLSEMASGFTALVIGSDHRVIKAFDGGSEQEIANLLNDTDIRRQSPYTGVVQGKSTRQVPALAGFWVGDLNPTFLLFLNNVRHSILEWKHPKKAEVLEVLSQAHATTADRLLLAPWAALVNQHNGENVFTNLAAIKRLALRATDPEVSEGILQFMNILESSLTRSVESSASLPEIRSSIGGPETVYAWKGDAYQGLLSNGIYLPGAITAPKEIKKISQVKRVEREIQRKVPIPNAGLLYFVLSRRNRPDKPVSAEEILKNARDGVSGNKRFRETFSDKTPQDIYQILAALETAGYLVRQLDKPDVTSVEDRFALPSNEKAVVEEGGVIPYQKRNGAAGAGARLADKSVQIFVTTPRVLSTQERQQVSEQIFQAAAHNQVRASVIVVDPGQPISELVAQENSLLIDGLFEGVVTPLQRLNKIEGAVRSYVRDHSESIAANLRTRLNRIPEKNRLAALTASLAPLGPYTEAFLRAGLIGKKDMQIIRDSASQPVVVAANFGAFFQNGDLRRQSQWMRMQEKLLGENGRTVQRVWAVQNEADYQKALEAKLIPSSDRFVLVKDVSLAGITAALSQEKGAAFDAENLIAVSTADKLIQKAQAEKGYSMAVEPVNGKLGGTYLLKAIEIVVRKGDLSYLENIHLQGGYFIFTPVRAIDISKAIRDVQRAFRQVVRAA